MRLDATTVGAVEEHRINVRLECAAAGEGAKCRIRMRSDCITAGMGAECRVCGRLGDARALVQERNTESACAWMP